MLWAAIAVLVVLWILGFTLKIAGFLIHILLVIAIILFIIGLVSRRRY